MALRVLQRFLGAALISAMLPALVQAQGVTATPYVTVVPPPPAGFDPVTASPAERVIYAVPPAPDPQLAPEAYAAWERAVKVPRSDAEPVIEPTSIFNFPARTVGQPQPISAGTATAYSGTWSGSAVTGGTFSMLEAIVGEFVVPTAHQAFGTCTGGWDFSSQWPGIDGLGSADVLQAGTEVDAYCSGSTTSSLYSAWVEFYPAAEMRVSVPAIHPGDLVYVQVWSTSTTTGYAYFVDYSNNPLQSMTYALTAPSGTTLKAGSVEWIVGMPGPSGASSATLTNYIDVAWPLGHAWNYTADTPTYYYMGATPSVGTLYEMTMIDAAGKSISTGNIENAEFLFFEDYGSACNRSGSPPC